MPIPNPQTFGPTNPLLSIRDVVRRTSLSRATVYRLSDEKRFPTPLQLTEGRKAWLTSEVDAWLAARVTERDDARRAADATS